MGSKVERHRCGNACSDARGTDPGISRRDFLMGVLASPAGIAAASALKLGHGAEETRKPRVVIARNPKIISGQKVDGKVAQEVLDRAICSLTGKSSSTDAWRSLFSPGEKVLIKINALFPPVTPSPEVVRAIVNGLRDAGLKDNNIVVHDRRNEELQRAGFVVNESSKGVQYRGSREHSAWMQAAPGMFRTQLCKLITDEVDAIINVPSLKTHWRSGVTLSLKNLLGCIPNAGETHGGGCPRIADISALDPIRKKTRLIVVDGVRAQYDRGPELSAPHVWNYAGLIVGTDAVAADAVGANEILSKRKAMGLDAPIRPSLVHITRAAEIGLGVADIDKIEVRRLANE
jgi:uncharacterized protein (DUF362 family)